MNNPLDNDVQFLKGVGGERKKLLNKMGIFTVRDVLFNFPRNYQDRTKIKKIAQTELNETCSVIARVVTPVYEKKINVGLVIYKFHCADESGTMNVTLFNQKYAAGRIKEGVSYIFYGKIEGNLVKREMTSPIFEEVDADGEIKGKIVPIYPLSAGVTQKMMFNITQNAIKLLPQNKNEIISAELRKKYGLTDFSFAINNIHNPADFAALDEARRRLVFEEFLVFQLGLFKLKNRNRGQAGIKFNKDVDMDEFYKNLPFKLTNAQIRTINEGLTDFKGEKPMSRLVQGDVGSGKTVVAAALIYCAVKNGYQSALMVPTEILAGQHLDTLGSLLDVFGIKTAILTGSQSEGVKNSIYSQIKNGEVDFVIGTHALIQDKVEFNRLALVVTDEQHRFGVKQRAVLTEKGDNPHVLVMSATPIPRTLALIMYGDLDISLIDEKPEGRQKVDTYLVDSSMRDRIYGFVKKQTEEGRQAYVVCPLAIENEELDIKSVESFANELSKKYFGDKKIVFMHGKLKGDKKNKIMSDFAQNKINVLVSTTVIEVGVNIPNVTVMVVENAERFGLSQLHQLRGRVGRGEYKSYCILISDSQSETTKERLDVMCKTNDGFKISEKDLQLRGPGDFFGERQSGILNLKIADLMTDIKILKEAQESAQEIIKNDPELIKEENRELKNSVNDLFGKNGLNAIFN